jgi:hypothetical protein
MQHICSHAAPQSMLCLHFPCNLNISFCVCRQQQPQLLEQQRQEQQKASELQPSSEQHPELDASDAAGGDATLHSLRDQTWPTQRSKALELLQARFNEYGQHASSSSSSILQLEPEVLLPGPLETSAVLYEGDDEDEGWRMLPDAVFVDVYDRLPPAAQG